MSLSPKFFREAMEHTLINVLELNSEFIDWKNLIKHDCDCL